AEAQGRPEVIAFGGMVVDDVEDDLDAGVMQSRHGRSKRVERRLDGITRLGGKEAYGIVAPIVAQAALDQVPVVDKGVDRQQFDGGDAKPLEMIDDGGSSQTAIRAAPCRRHILA